MSESKRRAAVAALVKRTRAERGMTLAATAMETGLHMQTIMKAEATGMITPRTARRLGAALGLDPQDITTRDFLD